MWGGGHGQDRRTLGHGQARRTLGPKLVMQDRRTLGPKLQPRPTPGLGTTSATGRDVWEGVVSRR